MTIKLRHHHHRGLLPPRLQESRWLPIRSLAIALLMGLVLSYGGQVFGQNIPELDLPPSEQRQIDKSALNVTERPTSIPTETWAVKLRPGTDADTLAARLGYVNQGRIANLRDTYLFVIPNTGVQIAALEGQTVDSLLSRAAEMTDTRTIQNAASALASASEILWYEQQHAHEMETRVPSDPLYPSQWHLNNTGQYGVSGHDANVVPAWNMGYDGTGVTISIVDDGMQHTHPDIAPNYYADASHDWNGNDPNPLPNLPNDGHGTSAGGVAAGADDGASCGVGVAYNARLSAQRILGGLATDAMEANALAYRNDLNHIYNNSWGPSDNGGVLGRPGGLTVGAIHESVHFGRNGLGNIYVWAAGNGNLLTPLLNDYVGADGYASSRYVIAVGATDSFGVRSWYSEAGSAVLVNAPSNGSLSTNGIRTTDLMGGNGYSSGDCMIDFGGTSSAAPLVSGVVALMLDANPNLSWRDVQHILVNTADRTDTGYVNSLTGWRLNGAGRYFSEYYGFGRVDAEEAVAWAKGWMNVPPEHEITSSVVNVNQTLADGQPTNYVTSTNTISTNIQYTEHVELILNLSTTYRGDIRVLLQSPNGTFSTMMLERPDAGDHYANWTFTSTHFWGENPNGVWKIYVSDAYLLDTGIFNNWQMRVYGTTIDPINRVGNGTFNDPIDDGGNRNWGVFSAPGPVSEDMTYFWTGSAIDINRKPRAAPNDSNNAGILQYTRRAVPNGAVMQLQFDAANTGMNRRRLTVIAWDEDFGDLRVCTFWLPAYSGLHTYTMRFRTSRAWTGAMLHFYAATADPIGYYRIDNVSLRHNRGETSSTTLCVDPLLPAVTTGTDSANLLENGDFDMPIGNPNGNWGLFPDSVEWQIINNVLNYRRAPALSSAVVLQNTTQSLPSGRRFEATFQLANTTGSTQRVTILIHAGDFSDLTACSFYVANSPTLQSYTMRGFATQAWSSASISFYLATTATTGYVQLDNASLRLRPALSITGTECYPAGVSPANAFDAERVTVPVILPTATAIPYVAPNAPAEIPIIIAPAPTEPPATDEGTIGE